MAVVACVGNAAELLGGVVEARAVNRVVRIPNAHALERLALVFGHRIAFAIHGQIRIVSVDLGTLAQRAVHGAFGSHVAEGDGAAD